MRTMLTRLVPRRYTLLTRIGEHPEVGALQSFYRRRSCTLVQYIELVASDLVELRLLRNAYGESAAMVIRARSPHKTAVAAPEVNVNVNVNVHARPHTTPTPVLPLDADAEATGAPVPVLPLDPAPVAGSSVLPLDAASAPPGTTRRLVAGTAAVAAEMKLLRKAIPLDGAARAVALRLEIGGHNPGQVALIALSFCASRTRSLPEAYAGPRLTLLLDLAPLGAAGAAGAVDAGLRSLLEDVGIAKTAANMSRPIAQLERCAGVRLKRFFDVSVAHNILKQGNNSVGSESDAPASSVTMPVKFGRLVEEWGLPENPHHQAVLVRAHATPLRQFWLQRPVASEMLDDVALSAETLLDCYLKMRLAMAAGPAHTPPIRNARQALRATATMVASVQDLPRTEVRGLTRNQRRARALRLYGPKPPRSPPPPQAGDEEDEDYEEDGTEDAGGFTDRTRRDGRSSSTAAAVAWPGPPSGPAAPDFVPLADAWAASPVAVLTRDGRTCADLGDELSLLTILQESVRFQLALRGPSVVSTITEIIMTVGQPVTVVRAVAAPDGLLHAQHEQLANSVVTAAQLAAGLRRAVGWLGPGTPVPARSMLPDAELHRVDVVFGDPPATAAAAAELALAFGVAGPRMPVGLVGRIGRAHVGLALALAGDVLARVCVLRHSLVVAPAGSRPGAGVTTALRDMARTLAEPPWSLDVVVLDRSLELGGGGGGAGSSAPHAGLGRARRWCPPAGSTLTDVLAECRPLPAVVVVDDVASVDELAECLHWAGAGIAVVAGVRDVQLLARARRTALIEGIVVDAWNCWTIMGADFAPAVQRRRRRTPRGVAVVEKRELF